ncbi:MAG TPA: 16S rRNA (guanine(966)-N(2))-methyltransferase RsmD [Burkholderiales bacterium]
MARTKAPPRGRPRGPATSYPGKIRIIGGRWRSRRLEVPAAEGLRPTPDRVRETLFNWLAPYIEGARCLDLFAGTGALCLEALSRGAAEVVMVERSAEAVRRLRENVARLGAEGAEVVALDALEYLAGRPRRFDVVFIDPPFVVAETIIRACAERLLRGWIGPGSFVYVEAPRRLCELDLPERFAPYRSAAAGQVRYQLLRLAPAPSRDAESAAS